MHSATQTNDTFRNDLDDYPDHYFLSPIAADEYEDWSSDSEDDGEGIEWSAGITDFALFRQDRRVANASKESPTLDRWKALLENQSFALQRSLQRVQATAESRRVLEPLLEADDTPGLTPDASPCLRDDLDDCPDEMRSSGGAGIPNYLTIIVTPPGEDHRKDQESKVLASVARKQAWNLAKRQRERPGLAHTRTLSGHLHSWRSPSWYVYTVSEEVDAEEREDLCNMDRIGGRIVEDFHDGT